MGIPLLASDIVKSVVRGKISNTASRERNEKSLRTGTVVVVLKYRDGIVMAADRQISAGSKIWGWAANKIRKVGAHSAIGWAGLVGIIQIIYDIYIRALLELEVKIEELPLESQVKIYQSVMQDIFLEYGDCESEFIFTGIDDGSGKSAIVHLDGAGAIYACEKFCAIGSGEGEAIAILQDYCDKHSAPLSEKSAMQLAIRALLQSGKRDIYVSDSRIVLPLITVIDKNGYRIATEKTVKSLIDESLKTGGVR